MPGSPGIPGSPGPPLSEQHRRTLPVTRRSVTHKFTIAGHEGYLTVGLYDEGQPGEIFLKVAKEGSTVSGLMDTIATMTSLALQYGVPLKTLVDKFSHTRFEPSGFTNNPEIPIAKSVTDYVFRFLGNRSSGRMGVALADAARARGARVTLLGANLQVPVPRGVELVPTPTASDLRREALARADADVVLMAAAVADYRPAEPYAGKRPKSGEPWTVDLVPTADVARALGAARREGQVLVAFGAESGEDGLARKREMLTDKNVDLVVYNDVGRDDIGFDSDDNEVVLVTRDAERVVAKAPKDEIAREILDEVERLLDGGA